MKLKGQSVKKLKPKNKKKIQKTLKRMKTVRVKDNIYLRDLMKQKLAWAKIERQKGITQLNQLQVKINRLDGIIIGMNDILNPQPEKNKE